MHQPLGPVDEHGHGELEYAGAPVPKRMNRITSPGRKAKGFLWRVPDPGEAPDTGRPAPRLRAGGGPGEDRQLAGRPKDPELRGPPSRGPDGSRRRGLGRPPPVSARRPGSGAGSAAQV